MSLLRSFPRLSASALLFPVALFLDLTGREGVALFAVAGIAILGTVTLIGKATEEIARYGGPVWGGLFNATFGNVTELILAFFALKKGLHTIVLSSVTGSILGNLLLVLGLAMLYGGLFHPIQRFSRTGAAANVGMLWVCLIALTVPSMVEHVYRAVPGYPDRTVEELVVKSSVAASVILLVIYLLNLVFSLRTHRFLLMPRELHEEEPSWPRGLAIGVLGVATVLVAYLSEAFVGALEHMLYVQHFEISELFLGVVVVALVGNAAEGSVAIWVARDNRMDLSFQIAMGSCLQVALLVAPLLVFASFLVGPEPLTLSFNLMELLFLGAGTVIASAALHDGESNWLEGAMFVGVYLFFAMVFWFHP